MEDFEFSSLVVDMDHLARMANQHKTKAKNAGFKLGQFLRDESRGNILDLAEEKLLTAQVNIIQLNEHKQAKEAEISMIDQEIKEPDAQIPELNSRKDDLLRGIIDDNNALAEQEEFILVAAPIVECMREVQEDSDNGRYMYKFAWMSTYEEIQDAMELRSLQDVQNRAPNNESLNPLFTELDVQGLEYCSLHSSGEFRTEPFVDISERQMYFCELIGIPRWHRLKTLICLRKLVKLGRAEKVPFVREEISPFLYGLVCETPDGIFETVLSFLA